MAGVPGVTELGLTEHCGANCGFGDTEQLSDTEPLKPFAPPAVSVAVADPPGLIFPGVSGDNDNVKSEVVFKSMLTNSEEAS